MFRLVTLELLSIPPLDLNQNQDKQDSGSGDRQMNSPSLRVSPQPGSGNCSEGFGDQSNSEDSSLSDSDRTLVGDAPGKNSVLSVVCQLGHFSFTLYLLVLKYDNFRN